MKNVFIALFTVDFLLVLYTFFVAKGTWLVNSQIAFVASSLIVFASILSYRSMVHGRLNVGAIPDDERDTLDKLEDPYDLYDEERKKDDEEKTLVEVVKEERANLKKSRRSFWEATKDSKASLSLYRLGAYGVLVLGFFYFIIIQIIWIF